MYIIMCDRCGDQTSNIIQEIVKIEVTDYSRGSEKGAYRVKHLCHACAHDFNDWLDAPPFADPYSVAGDEPSRDETQCEDTSINKVCEYRSVN